MKTFYQLIIIVLGNSFPCFQPNFRLARDCAIKSSVVKWIFYIFKQMLKIHCSSFKKKSSMNYEAENW